MSTEVQRLKQSVRKRTNKFHAKKAPCNLGGKPHVHDSEKERERHHVLITKQAMGEIRNLRYHTKWALFACDALKMESILICMYESDFDYICHDHLVVEDVKSPPTRELEVYKLKKKWMKACYDIEIVEV